MGLLLSYFECNWVTLCRLTEIIVSSTALLLWISLCSHQIALLTLWPVIELSKWRWGVEIFCRWGVREEVGGRNFFSTRGWKRGGGRILSWIIEERGKWHNKLSLWCKSFIRNLFKRSSHCLPQHSLIIIRHAPIRLVLFYTIKLDRI